MLDHRVIVPTNRSPHGGFLEALNRLIRDREEFRSFARLTHDPRLSLNSWTLLLRKELLMLNCWSLRKLLLNATNEGQKLIHRPNRRPSKIIDLLPKYGLAIHILRRAVPFAALEVPTYCGFPAETRVEGRAMVDAIGKALDIEAWLKPLLISPERAVVTAKQNHIIVITGRRKSIAAVIGRSKARCIGSGGRCVVVVGHSRQSVTHLIARLRGKHVINSCTRVRAGFLLSSRFQARGLGKNPWVGPLHEALERLHPSIVIEAFQKRRTPSLKTVAGYRVVRADDEGKIDDQSGFAADPLYGWPGDYAF